MRDDGGIAAALPDAGGFADWADEAAGGDRDLAALLLRCALRFRRRHSCLFLDRPGPGFRAMVRLFRGVAVLREEGHVRSAEFFRIPDIDRFFADPAERAATLAATAWDDRATLFAPRQPPRRTREAPPLVDWSGAACVGALPDQLRQLEYLLNADLHRDPRADLVLEPAGPAGASRGASRGAARGPARTRMPSSHRPLRAELRESLAARLRPLVAAEAAAALDAFRSRLDPDRLDALARAGANGVAAYNWLAGFDRGSCDADLALRRTQAVAAYPIAWSLVSAPVGAVADAVGEARPLVPALAAALGIPEGALRRVNGLGAAEADLSWPPDAHGAAAIVRRAARMPPGQPPRSPSGWRAFFAALDLADAVDRLRAAAAEGTQQGAPPAAPLGPGLLASSAGRWDALDPEALAQAAAGLADMVQDVHANLAEPTARFHGVRGWTRARTLERIAGGRTLPQLAAASAWWHERQADIRARLAARFPRAGASRAPRSWPPLHAGGPWLATNGLVVLPLTDEGMLVDEHRRMGHCINSYAPEALYRGAHLLSVRTASGRGVGTAEIRQGDILRLAGSLAEPPDAPLESLPPSVVQFRAERNGPPRLEGWVALWEYVSAIMTGALEIDAGFLREDLGRRRARGRLLRRQHRGRAPRGMGVLLADAAEIGGAARPGGHGRPGGGAGGACTRAGACRDGEGALGDCRCRSCSTATRTGSSAR